VIAMSAEEIIRTYGYLAISVGTFFEGEMIMLAAGVAAAAGYLNLPGALLAGMLGIFLSDTLCFLIGRFLSARLFRWFPKLYARMENVFVLVEKHQAKLIVFFQFFPGLCTVTPIAYGMSRISLLRFMAFDFAGNVLWTFAFTLGGFFCGQAMKVFVIELQGWMLAATILLVLSIGACVLWKVRGAALKNP
jgi:membrane protein DedA with SNARE-associated domain